MQLKRSIRIMASWLGLILVLIAFFSLLFSFLSDLLTGKKEEKKERKECTLASFD